MSVDSKPFDDTLVDTHWIQICLRGVLIDPSAFSEKGTYRLHVSKIQFHGLEIIAGAASFHTGDHKFRRAIPLIVRWSVGTYNSRRCISGRRANGPLEGYFPRHYLKVANIHGLQGT